MTPDEAPTEMPTRTLEERVKALEDLTVLKEITAQMTATLQQMGPRAPAALALSTFYLTRNFLGELHQLVAWMGMINSQDPTNAKMIPLILRFAEGLEKTYEDLERRISLQEEALGKVPVGSAKPEGAGLVGPDGKPL